MRNNKHIATPKHIFIQRPDISCGQHSPLGQQQKNEQKTTQKIFLELLPLQPTTLY